MKKSLLLILCIMLLLSVTGCKKKEEPKEEKTESTTISEEIFSTEEILVTGEGGDSSEEQTTATSDTEGDATHLDPLNDGSVFDPEYNHIDIYQQDFDRYKMGADILSLLETYKIEGNCKSVTFEEYNADRYQYIVTLKMDNGNELKVEYYIYANARHMYPYDEDQDLGYHEGQ